MKTLEVTNFLIVLISLNIFWLAVVLNLNHSSKNKSWILQILFTMYLFLTSLMLVACFYKPDLVSIQAVTIPAIITMVICKLKYSSGSEIGFFIIEVVPDALVALNMCLLIAMFRG